MDAAMTENHMNISFWENKFDVSACGKFDCQDAEVTEARIQNYKPVNKNSQIVVTVLSFFLVLTSTLLYYFYLPYTDEEKVGNLKNNNTKTVKSSLFKEVLISLRNIWSVLQLPMFYLVILLPFYNGLLWTFLHGEMTRAFASCILGLRYVSLSMIVYSVCATLSSYCFGLLASIKGVSIPFMFGFLTDMSLYTACLCINPTTASWWAVLGLFGGFGVSSGIWLTLTVEVMSAKLPKDLASPLWAVLFHIGCGSLSLFSVSLCVVSKVYLMAAVLLLAMIMYVHHRCRTHGRQKEVDGSQLFKS